MSKSLRALLGIGMWLVIYYVAVYVIPSRGIFQRFVQEHAWLSKGEISQITFLVVSLVLIFAFANGDIRTYGMRGIKARQLVRPVCLGLLVSVLFFILSAIVMMVGGLPGEEGGSPMMSKSLLNFVLTVVILASICEEIFSRGLVQSFLSPLKDQGLKLGKVHISLPVTICGVLFGLGHLCLLGSMASRVVMLIVISATILGLIAGYFREKTDSLLPAIAVHMTFNIVSGVVPKLLITAASG